MRERGRVGEFRSGNYAMFEKKNSEIVSFEKMCGEILTMCKRKTKGFKKNKNSCMAHLENVSPMTSETNIPSK